MYASEIMLKLNVGYQYERAKISHLLLRPAYIQIEKFVIPVFVVVDCDVTSMMMTSSNEISKVNKEKCRKLWR